jgi:GNAT superfamily N-acetyltransferase
MREDLQQLLSLAKQKGCRVIELDSAFHREEAHRFYEHLGFEKRAYLFTKTL